jgi:hypothetical protein
VGGIRDHLPLKKPSNKEWWTSALSATLLTALFFVPVVVFVIEYLGAYSIGLFAVIPAALGFVAATIVNRSAPRRFRDSLGVAMGALGLLCALLLGFMWEGFVCIIMAAPIELLFTFIGCLIGHEIQELKWVRRHQPPMLITVFALLPVVLLGEARLAAAPASEMVTNSVIVHASPEKIWPYLLNLSNLQEPQEVLFRAAVAHPTSTRTIGQGVGAKRFCDLSTGPMTEVIETWKPNRELEFRVLDTPPSMKEMNPFGEVDAPHLHGYFECRRGRFVLTPLPDGTTRLEGTSWYEYRIFPAGYWRLWTDKIVSDVQLRVMREIKQRAERSNGN